MLGTGRSLRGSQLASNHGWKCAGVGLAIDQHKLYVSRTPHPLLGNFACAGYFLCRDDGMPRQSAMVLACVVRCAYFAFRAVREGPQILLPVSVSASICMPLSRLLATGPMAAHFLTIARMPCTATTLNGVAVLST